MLNVHNVTNSHVPHVTNRLAIGTVHVEIDRAAEVSLHLDDCLCATVPQGLEFYRHHIPAATVPANTDEISLIKKLNSNIMDEDVFIINIFIIMNIMDEGLMALSHERIIIFIKKVIQKTSLTNG